VVCAQLAALGEKPGGEAEGAAAAADEQALRLWGVGPLAGAAACAALGLLLADNGWRAVQVDRFRRAALRCRAEPGPEARERQIQYLEAAVARAPEDGSLHIALADAYSRAYKERPGIPGTAAEAAAAGRAVLAYAPLSPVAPPAVAATAAWLGSRAAQQESDRKTDEELAHRYLSPALRHYLRARDSCPLLVPPQVQLAALRGRLDRADARRVYLERAARLRPSDAELWYLAGAQQLLDGEQAGAWQSWHRSLECSDAFLGEIVRGSSRILGPDAVISQVLPDNPALLAGAAAAVGAPGEEDPRRTPFLARALALLRERPGALPAKDYHLQATIHSALGQPAEALDAYRVALDRDPLQAGWRYEFARLLYQQGRPRDAERELRAVLRDQPGNREAHELFRTVLQGTTDND
jgi:tetratricopeptide (TPR) repeat protein